MKLVLLPGLICLLLASIFAFAQAMPNTSVPPADAADVELEIRQVEQFLPKLPDRGAGLFLLAHDYAHLGKTEKAFSALQECISLDAGFDPEGDPDLAVLKSNPKFNTLAERVHRRYPAVHRAQTAFVIAEPDLFPEGLAEDPRSSMLYMGSLHFGKIVEIAKDGTVSDFIKAGQYSLGPICGLKVDPVDGSVWGNTCPDSGVGAELFHFDSGGKLLKRFSPPTPGKHLFNDLVLRGPDEIYLTDSLANRAFRFDRKSHTFSELSLCRTVYYPNGIALSDDGKRLYVADAFGILKVDVKTGGCHEVEPGKSNTVSGADGLYWYKDSLVAVQNSLGSPRIARFRLSPDGNRVLGITILEYRTPFVSSPTTGAIVGSKFYFMSNTQIDNLKGDKILDPSKLEPVRISAIDLGP